jgi:hypothetical protein
MFATARRRAAQVISDPVLRRWLVGFALGRHRRPPRFTAGAPPYLDERPQWRDVPEAQMVSFPALDAAPPDRAITLPLPGRRMVVTPGEEGGLFDASFDDTETLLAIHRFAWVPLLGTTVEAGWVDALWREWAARFATVDKGWAWHPYTAAERAINILDFARRKGLPGEVEKTLALLVRHGTSILDRLEYFGDHNTSNHLSNNGRGLFLLGLALGIDEFAETGGHILIAEAARIFGPSGVLREGSTHYHLLLTRNYASAWLAARTHGHPETATLEGITRRALAAIPHLTLPGGMPLIGDISPDCPPEFLAGLLPGGDMESGWCGLLSQGDRDALGALKRDCGTISPDRIKADGWVRAAFGPWTALCHASPGGWSPMPGHGHQDMGGFELHFETEAVFVDRGRGAYGETGEAAAYVAGRAHNTLSVDGLDPYPANRPYYDSAFRQAVGGGAPRISRSSNEVTLAHDGYRRLDGVGTATRRLKFEGRTMRIVDRVEGSSRRNIARHLHTGHVVHREPGGAVIEGKAARYRLTADGEIKLSRGTCWTAYGEGVPSTVIDIASVESLPVETEIAVEAL